MYMVEARKLGLAVSDEMYDSIVRIKDYRKLYTVPETVRMLLSEKVEEEEKKMEAEGISISTKHKEGEQRGKSRK